MAGGGIHSQTSERSEACLLEAGGHLIMIYCMIPVIPGLENLYFSQSSAIVAEIWAVITCLEGARDGGFKQLHSQIDSAVTVEMLQDEVCASIPQLLCFARQWSF